jgi:hypothetical protein
VSTASSDAVCRSVGLLGPWDPQNDKCLDGLSVLTSVVGPVVNVGGWLIVDSLRRLGGYDTENTPQCSGATPSFLQRPILTEQGAMPPPSVEVATGSSCGSLAKLPGSAFTSDCTDFTSTDFRDHMVYGRPSSSGPDWSNAGAGACTDQYSLYCIESTTVP